MRHYGYWVHENVKKKIGHLYPKIKISSEMVDARSDLKPYLGQELKVIAWVWARTVKSPNPAYDHVDVPLARSFILSKKKGKEAWIQPVIDGDAYHFKVRLGTPPEEAKVGTKLARGINFRCIMSDSPMNSNYIKAEANSGRMSTRMMAIIAEGIRGRIYLPPTKEMEDIASQARPEWRPGIELPNDALGIIPVLYGFTKFGDLFTDRQLVSLATFSDLIPEVRAKVIEDARKTGWDDDGKGLNEGGTGATAYGDAVAVYIAFCINRCVDFNNSFTVWMPKQESLAHLFARPAIPMMWDFGEANILERVVGGFTSSLEYQVKCLLKLHGDGLGYSSQQDAANQDLSTNKVISTDPPYYDNIGYADLSDFFYSWMRRSLNAIYPNLFSTITVPKQEELIANPHRHGNKKEAENFFLEGMTQAMNNMAKRGHPAFPVSIYYAFKQSETKEGRTTSTGWVTFLEAVIHAGFVITGTWPVRTEQSIRLRAQASNALASSIVLVCRKRPKTSETISRRDFQRLLRNEMPKALETMVSSETVRLPIAPVDLAQSAIGPGMAIFSKYENVLNQDGSSMSVSNALVLINRSITDYLNPESGNFDADTLFCSTWFDQYGWGKGPFGQAEILSKAKGTSVDGVRESRVVESGGGKVRLLRWTEYDVDWDSTTDYRNSIWGACHQMIHILNKKGESASGKILAEMPDKSELIRQLAYHLYTLCERKNLPEEARAYNEFIGCWSAIIKASVEARNFGTQIELF